MKLTKNILLASLFASALTITSCGGGGGKWSEDEQKDFMDGCTPGASENPEIDADKSCSCMLEKIMDKYPKVEDADKMTISEMTDIAKDCM